MDGRLYRKDLSMSNLIFPHDLHFSIKIFLLQEKRGSSSELHNNPPGYRPACIEWYHIAQARTYTPLLCCSFHSLQKNISNFHLLELILPCSLKSFANNNISNIHYLELTGFAHFACSNRLPHAIKFVLGGSGWLGILTFEKRV